MTDGEIRSYCNQKLFLIDNGMCNGKHSIPAALELQYTYKGHGDKINMASAGKITAVYAAGKPKVANKKAQTKKQTKKQMTKQTKKQTTKQ